jgi:hypothetical protein
MRLLPLLASLLVLPVVTHAGDIADEVRNPGQSPAAENGGFLEIGLIVGAESRPWQQYDPADNDQFDPIAGIVLSGSYRYKRVFAEVTVLGLDGLNLGANLWQNQRWAVDFLALNVDGKPPSNSEPTDENLSAEEQRDRKLLDRDNGFVSAGIRVTGYFGDTISQFRLVSDYYNSHGIIASARIGRQWLAGNWKIQGLLGARFNSAKINQSWYGVDTAEATLRFPAWQADNSIQLETQLGVSYPINQDWVFRSDLLYIRYPAAIANSPLLANSHDFAFTFGLSYVF